jgi:predicted DNA-binding protein
MQFYATEAILEYLDDVEDRYMAMNRIADEAANGIDEQAGNY